MLLKDVLKDSCVLKFCEICRKASMMKFAVKEVTVFSVATFLNETLYQICFLRNLPDNSI